MKNAHQEICVLADVLAIAKDKRYMVLDPVQQEPLETKPMVQIYARKKALTGKCVISSIIFWYDKHIVYAYQVQEMYS